MLAGLSRSLGVDANLLRVVTVVAALFAGPAVLLAYLVGWLVMPVDEALPSHERPSSAPGALLVIVGAIIAIQITFGLITNLPFTWIVIAGIAGYWFFIRD